MRRIPEDVDRSYADSLAGSTENEAAKLIEEWLYVAMLYSHDWSFADSQDHGLWLMGRAERQDLMETQRKLDPDFKLWNAHCPPDERVPSSVIQLAA